MTLRTMTLDDLKKRTLEEVLREVVEQQEVLMVRLPDGQEIRIQPARKLKPLPVLKGKGPRRLERCRPRVSGGTLFSSMPASPSRRSWMAIRATSKRGRWWNAGALVRWLSRLRPEYFVRSTPH
jgi:hypothetical protein